MQLRVEVAAHIVLGFACCRALGAHLPCQEPSEAALEAVLSRHQAPGSFLAPPEEEWPERAPKLCPANASQTSPRLQDRSASPWSYRVNEDPRRFPRRLLEAYCLCEGCLTGRREDRAVRSEPFLQEVLVLQNSGRCKAGRYVYQPHRLPLARFCVCTFP
ncbi:interleukin-17D-like [Pelodiscus sinensis]|uniref:interleukin-17D-like n=1 Tax=Pelodiscus sinensis TaxID=13735 RepID=UPI003F6B6DCB